MKKLIVVVCRGNIARSPFAEAIINDELTKRKLNDKYEVLSRGVQGTIVDPIPVKFPNISFYPDLYNDAKPALDKFRVDITKHISKPINKEVAELSSLILAVDQKTYDGLQTLFPKYKSKIHLLSELAGEEKDFEDPEGAKGTEKQMIIFTGIEKVIREGFLKLC